jgi:HAD superfamily hydrolase (TIGR01549 family)
MEHDAWLVDLDGTLYHPLPVKAAMALELSLLGWGVVGTLRAFRKQHEQLREHPPVDADPYRTQIGRTAEERGVGAERVAAAVTEWMHERPGKWIRAFRRSALLDEIHRYRAGGGKTALVSDYPSAKKLSALDARSLFDVVVSSGEEGGPRRLKPDPEGYLLAASRLGVAPARCLVIGDREDADGDAARAAGMAFRRIR